MNQEFLEYYDRELAFIRLMGAEFAGAHAQVAGHLRINEAGHCADPHVERLLEAFAFLSARIRKKIDDEYPEITDALLSVVYPHYQQPIPSMAIVQFVPTTDATKISGGHVIKRNEEPTTPPVKGSSCRFRTAYPTRLWPVAVESASLAPDRVAIAGKPASSVALLQLGLRCTAQGDWASLEGFDSLRFYLDGGEPIPTSIYESLFNDLCEVWVRGKVAGGSEKTVVLPRDSVKPVGLGPDDWALPREPAKPPGFGPDDWVLPYPTRSFDGYRLLQEFFAFPPKFLFFDLENLAVLRSAKFEGAIEVFFFLKQAPRTKVVIRPNNFRLGCTPVVNLFEMAAEPIRLNRLQTTYTVVPKYGALDGHEVYSVNGVVSVGSYLEGSVKFQPFYAMRHSKLGTERRAYWFASRRHSRWEATTGSRSTSRSSTPISRRWTHRSRRSPRTSPAPTATSRPGSPSAATMRDFQLESDAPVGRVRLLTKPTRTLRPPIKKDAQWR